MEKGEYDRYYEVLELKPGAPPHEVNRAYVHLKGLYSRDSIVTSPLESEFDEGQREEILGQIEEAYARLAAMFRESAKGAASGAEGPLKAEMAGTSFTGGALKSVREALGVDLQEIELATRVQKRHFENIEGERFDKLPAEVFVRGYLRGYAKYLSLDADKVVDDYMKGYGEWKKGKEGRAT